MSKDLGWIQKESRLPALAWTTPENKQKQSRGSLIHYVYFSEVKFDNLGPLDFRRDDI